VRVRRERACNLLLHECSACAARRRAHRTPIARACACTPACYANAIPRAHGLTRCRICEACLRAEPACIAQPPCAPACAPSGSMRVSQGRITACPLCVHAATPRTMPPLSRRNLKKLVQRLGGACEQDERKLALVTAAELCRDPASQAAIVAAGVMTSLRWYPCWVLALQMTCSWLRQARWCTSLWTRTTRSTAGAIPQLVQLLGPGCSAVVWQNAAGALAAMNADNAVAIAAAGGPSSGAPAGSWHSRRRAKECCICTVVSCPDNAVIAAAGALICCIS
jgi:hypothetical protein